MNKNYKAYNPYIGLIIVILAALSFGLIKFNTTTTIVKANSTNQIVTERNTDRNETIPSSDFCTWGNTIYLDPYRQDILIDSNGLDEENGTVTFIYKLDEPLNNKSLYFYPTVTYFIAGTTDSNIQSPNYLKESLKLNNESTYIFSEKDNNEFYSQYDFQYIQILAPHSYQGTSASAFIQKYELKLTFNDGTTLIPKLTYILHNKSQTSINGETVDSVVINNAFNVPIVTSVEDLYTEIEYRYLTFQGTHGSNDSEYGVGLEVTEETTVETRIAMQFKWMVYDNIAYPTMSFEDMFKSMESSQNMNFINRYYVSRLEKYKFVGWDKSPNELDYSQSWTVNAIYEQVELVEYPIIFYGIENEIIYTSTIRGLSDNNSTLQKDLKDSYIEANYIAFELSNSGTQLTSPYFNKWFTDWSIPYSDNLWESITSSIEVFGSWDFKKIEHTISIYDENNNFIKTILVNSGTLFGDLSLTSPELENYEFMGFYEIGIDGDKVWLIKKMENTTMITDNINIQPVYQRKIVTVKISTRAVYENYTPIIEIDNNGFWTIDGIYTGVQANTESNTEPQIGVNKDGLWTINDKNTNIKAKEYFLPASFFSKDLFFETCDLGQTIILPLSIYYDGFVPKFYTNVDEHITSGNYDELYSTRICDASATTLMIPNDEDLINGVYNIYLVYRYEQNKIIDNNPIGNNGSLPYPGGSNNNFNQDDNIDDSNKISDSEAEPDYRYLILFGGTTLAIIVCVLIALEIIKRRNNSDGRKKENKTKTNNR